MRSNPATQELADEEVWDPENKNVTYIQPYVLLIKQNFIRKSHIKMLKDIKGGIGIKVFIYTEIEG